METEDSCRLRPLHWAASIGHVAIVRVLLEKEAMKEALAEYGLTPLLCIAGVARTEPVKLRRDIPLVEAASRDCVEVVRVLLENGAKIEAASKDGSTPLIIAARWGHAEVARILLEKGANKQAANEDFWTPLLSAGYYGHVKIVNLLLETRANKQAFISKSWSPRIPRHSHTQAQAQAHAKILTMLSDDKHES